MHGALRQFIVYFATSTFQSIQNYLCKLSGKRLSGKVIVRETSVTLTQVNNVANGRASSPARALYTLPIPTVYSHFRIFVYSNVQNGTVFDILIS